MKVIINTGHTVTYTLTLVFLFILNALSIGCVHQEFSFPANTINQPAARVFQALPSWGIL